MYNNKKILSIIPARGGSKGIFRKNIKSIAGKPLIAWSIIEGNKSQYTDKVVISSDDDEIIQIAENYGGEAPFIRPKELAQDDTPGVLTVIHAIKELPDFDYVVLLQPTSPLRNYSDIDQSIKFCIDNKANSCVSVVEASKSPFLMLTINNENRMIPLLKNGFILRRQEQSKVYMLNGAIFIAKTKWLMKTKNFIDKNTIAYIMPQERSIDIDSEFDIKLCELLFKENVNG
ncbi:MAG: acylneuraminate cytidylyltransferase family protein [Candidatus Magnetomorum sp.]|nr:acylneuraminate cytidylyltransferase family protein [Candidatus Magnetomorum sp.]